MSITKGELIDTIFRAIDEINKLSPPESQLHKDPSTILLGETGALDSLGLINLIVAIEERIHNDHGIQVIVLEEDALASPEGAYRSIDTLAVWILEKIV